VLDELALRDPQLQVDLAARLLDEPFAFGSGRLRDARFFSGNLFLAVRSQPLELARQRGLDEGMDLAAMAARLRAPDKCADQAELLGRITLTTAMKDLADADFVVEAVVAMVMMGPLVAVASVALLAVMSAWLWTVSTTLLAQPVA